MKADFLLLTILVACLGGDTASAKRSPASIGIVGNPADVIKPTIGGTVLAGGGTDVDEVFQWMINKTGAGDFVVIRASGTDAYNSYIYGLGIVDSVETLLINSTELANDPEVEATILGAEGLFIAGGDQANYVNFWKVTKVHAALDHLRNVKQIPIGGTSAGCAILGGVYFSALKGTVTSEEVLENPYDSYLTLGYNDFLNQPFLADVVTDTHFDNRDRQGRMVTFLARMITDKKISARGIGADESTAVCIEPNGQGKVYGSGYAYFFSPNSADDTPETCRSRTALDWYRNKKAVRTYKLPGTTDGYYTFDVDRWTTSASGRSFYYYVDRGVLRTSS